MPALKNPRHERYAQLIVEGLNNGHPKPYSQSQAYLAAGYTAKDLGKRGGSAQAASSRLLYRVIQRVRELQTIAAKNAAETAEKMARELNEIQHEARADKAHAAAVSAVLGKAKVLNITVEKHEIVENSNMPKNSREIAISLLRDVGLEDPSDEAIELALQAYDRLVAGLERIRVSRWGLRRISTTHIHRPKSIEFCARLGDARMLTEYTNRCFRAAHACNFNKLAIMQ
jgi:hypothetical protein